jgi:hypothetical protein
MMWTHDMSLTPTRIERSTGHLAWALLGAALCYGVWGAIDGAWVCDDAFISFRYCRNLIDGLGLVYNAGEHVEGYTNFLWVMLIAGGMGLGAEPVVLGQVLGVLFFVGTIAVLWHSARLMGTIPLAAIGLALHQHTQIFSTCGLETSMYTFLVTSGLVALIGAEKTRQFALGGLCLILATMTRPDGALFYVLGGTVVVSIAARRRDWRPFVGYAASFVLLYVPYFFWKFAYYGHALPNTFYAKSASEPYVGQGFYYVRLYLTCYYYLIPALVVPLWILLRRNGDTGVETDGRRGPLLVTLFTLPFLMYVIWVGGDFMFARFCLPVTPALFLGLQFLVRTHRWSAFLVTAIVLVASFATLYPAETIKLGNPRTVAEERDHYPAWTIEAYRKIGSRLAEIFAGQDLRVVIGGSQAMLAYFGEFPYALEINGLTDEFIAHRKLEKRGKVGHEKQLPLDHEYLTQKGVDMMVGALAIEWVRVPNDRLAEQRHFEFHVENIHYRIGDEDKMFTGYARATLITYDRDLLRAVRGREDVRFPDFEAYLDRYIARLDQIDRDEVRLDLAAFDAFYFGCNDDPDRRSKIEKRLP